MDTVFPLPLDCAAAAAAESAAELKINSRLVMASLLARVNGKVI
jgi:hypothetical protein